MTSGPMLAVAATRDPRAEAAIGAGLAAYDAEKFRPGDWAALDAALDIGTNEDEPRRVG